MTHPSFIPIGTILNFDSNFVLQIFRMNRNCLFCTPKPQKNVEVHSCRYVCLCLWLIWLIWLFGIIMSKHTLDNKLKWLLFGMSIANERRAINSLRSEHNLHQKSWAGKLIPIQVKTLFVPNEKYGEKIQWLWLCFFFRF